MLHQKCNRLTVISRAENKNKRAYWNCLCDCGNITTVSGKKLRSGQTKSCGCLHKEVMSQKKLPNALSSFNKLFSMYCVKAKSRRHRFSLSRKAFRRITKSNCFYCGIKPSQEIRRKPNSDPYIYNGVDRVDNNNENYTLNNCVPCCSACNYAKRMMPVEEFKNWIDRAYHHLFDNS